MRVLMYLVALMLALFSLSTVQCDVKADAQQALHSAKVKAGMLNNQLHYIYIDNVDRLQYPNSLVY